MKAAEVALQQADVHHTEMTAVAPTTAPAKIVIAIVGTDAPTLTNVETETETATETAITVQQDAATNALQTVATTAAPTSPAAANLKATSSSREAKTIQAQNF